MSERGRVKLNIPLLTLYFLNPLPPHTTSQPVTHSGQVIQNMLRSTPHTLENKKRLIAQQRVRGHLRVCLLGAPCDEHKYIPVPKKHMKH